MANHFRHGSERTDTRPSTPRHWPAGSLYAISWRVERRKRASRDGETWEHRSNSRLALGPRVAIPFPPLVPPTRKPPRRCWELSFLRDAQQPLPLPASPICEQAGFEERDLWLITLLA
jgi:hypothetical protein